MLFAAPAALSCVTTAKIVRACRFGVGHVIRSFTPSNFTTGRLPKRASLAM